MRRKHRQEQARPRAPMSRFSSQDALRQMASEMQNNALLPRLTPVINPPGQEKVSDVIWQFIAPYSSYADDLASMQKLVTIAAIAWNAAIMSEEDSAGFLDRMIETFPADTREDAEAVIGDLIQRKKRYFATNKRLIVNMKVTDTGDGFHLVVASSMPGADG